MPGLNSGKERNSSEGSKSLKNGKGRGRKQIASSTAQDEGYGSQIPGRAQSIPLPIRSAGAAQKRAKGLSRRVAAPTSGPIMTHVGIADGEVPVPPKLLKRFYEALAMLFILGQNRGEPTDEDELEMETEADPSDMDSHRLRRSFTKNLAYLCDYEKGGESTCAIGLQQTRQGIIYLFASNKSPDITAGARDRAIDFLDDVLSIPKTSSLNDESVTESILFMKSVSFSSSRIDEYSKALRRPLEYVLSHVEEANIASDSTFIKWLAAIKDALPSPNDICRLCHDIRHTDNFRSLGQRASDGAPCASRFERIRHLIGRLNHTMKAVKVVIGIWERLPRLFDDFEIVRVPSQAALAPPLQERNPSLAAIAGRLINDAELIERHREDLDVLDKKFNLSNHLSQLCALPTWRPKVHAELILVDLFWTQKLEFVGGDRYIGCSKPACFCCYHYIRAHPGRFATPACHNNNWLNWRPPDIKNSNEIALIKLRTDILNEMAKEIRNEVLGQISEQRGPRGRQPDSNTEISSAWPRITSISTEMIRELTSDACSPDEMADFSSRSSVIGSDGDIDNDSAAGCWRRAEQSWCPEIDRESEDEDDDEGGVILATPPSESAPFASAMPGS